MLAGANSLFYSESSNNLPSRNFGKPEKNGQGKKPDYIDKNAEQLDLNEMEVDEILGQALFYNYPKKTFIVGK